MTQRIPPDFGLAFSFNPLLWGTAMKRKLIVGIDGTRTGWIAAYIRPGGNSIELKHATRLQDLLPAFPDGIIAVDMPLWLPEEARPGGRPTDVAARALLRGRASCVFSPPSSAALHATDHAEACRLNRASSPHQLALSCQSYALIPKLREVLGIMATQSGIRDCLWEVHPEVCFATMNNGAPLMHRKKSAEGHRARSTLVTQAFGCPVERLIEQGREWGAQPDDVLDALASLWTAQRIAAKSAVPVLAASDRQEHLDHPWKVIWR